MIMMNVACKYVIQIQGGNEEGNGGGSDSGSALSLLLPLLGSSSSRGSTNGNRVCFKIMQYVKAHIKMFS